jgi:hypothetical protein
MRKKLAIAMISALATGAPAQAAQQDGANTPEARMAIAKYGQCAAQREPAEANRLLTMDFTTDRYRTGIRILSKEVQRKCAYGSFGSGKMRSAGLLFSGAMAEALLEADATPLNRRIAGTVHLPVQPYSTTDAIALCVVRSAPDEVAKLFASDVASESEQAAVKELDYVTKLCSQGKPELRASAEAVRAMLATAAFRAVNAAPAEKS